MDLTPEFNYSTSSQIQNKISDSLDANDILSVSLNIKASHAGKINNNFVFYTPRSMQRGSETLTVPFKKHLQNLHKGDAVGVINEASFIDYSEKYSETIKSISNRIDTASSSQELVSAVKDLIATKEYAKGSFKGLGVLQVSAELYNETLIKELATGTNKGKVSIGGNSRQVYCSVCTELFTKNHKHVKGKSYGGETCFAIYDDMVLDHIGFVPDPADDTTETTIVTPISDSLEVNDATVSIEDIKIQDNIQGKKPNMNLEDLKQQLKTDTTYLVGLVGELPQEQVDALNANLTSSQSYLRASGYLFSEEKLLPINTKENIALAKLAIAQLEDGPVKTGFETLLAVQLDKHFEKDEDTLQVLKDFAAPEKKEPEVPKEPTIVTEEGGDIKTAVSPHSLSLSEEDLKNLIVKVTEGIVEGLKPTQAESQAIADSMQLDVVVNRNKQLEADIAAIDVQNNELTNKYKDSIITQILLHKGLKADDAYAESLSKRDMDALLVLLEDVQLDATRNTVTTSTTDTKTTEAKQDTKTDATPAPVTEKVTIKDSIDNNTSTASTSLPDLQELGLSKYLAAMSKINKN